MIIFLIFLFRKFDYEHFLCTMYLPKEAQVAVMALRALNIELAMVRDQVRESALGHMRFQFWRETIDDSWKVHGIRLLRILLRNY